MMQRCTVVLLKFSNSARVTLIKESCIPTNFDETGAECSFPLHMNLVNLFLHLWPADMDRNSIFLIAISLNKC
jgi:hypothetical protein